MGETTYNPLRPVDDRDPWQIITNTGGPVDVTDHVGHIAEYERAVAATLGPGRVGARFSGDRRMGKSSLLALLENVLTRQDMTVLRISGETGEIEAFGERIVNVLRTTSWLEEEFRRWEFSVDIGYKGTHIRRTGKDKKHRGQDHIDDLFEYAVRHAPGAKLVVMLDEVTVVASAFAASEPDAGLEFLRSLRRARQAHPDRLAMILSGSVGLHHVVDDLTPVNDLTPIRIGPLQHDEAVFLGRCLFLGELIDTDDPAGLAEAIASAAGDVAYYIQHIVSRLAGRPAVAVDDVADLVTSLIHDPDDPADFRHYRDRIPDYYGSQAPVVLRMLDVYAASDEPLAIDDVVRLLGLARLENRPTRDDVVILVEKLEQDNYLIRRGDDSAFSSDLLRAAWRSLRR